MPRPIQTDRAPLPGGHYSQAIVHAGLVYVSGQLPIRPGQGPMAFPRDTIEAQARQVLANLEAILLEAGTTPALVLKVVVYVSDISLWHAVNREYTEFFARHGGHRPARSMVPVNELHYGYQIELDAIAAMPEGRA